jgi:WD40 repeat protein
VYEFIIPQNSIKLTIYSCDRAVRHNNDVKSLAISSNNLFLVSGGPDKNLKIWSLKNNQCLGSITHQKTIESVAISPDNKTVVVGCEDGSIRLYSIEHLTNTKFSHCL